MHAGIPVSAVESSSKFTVLKFIVVANILCVVT